VKQRRTIASIDDHTDGNNRPNKRNMPINSCDDDDEDDDDYNDDEMVTGTECLFLSTTICKTRHCSRCIEAILNEASFNRSISQRVVPSHEASNCGWDEGKYTHCRYEGIP
jgi:hypothetical protein